MIAHRYQSIACWTFCICSIATLGCIGTPDKSGFHKFKYTSRPAMGYCPNVHGISEATITRANDMTYTLAMSIDRANDKDKRECNGRWNLLDRVCVDSLAMPVRTVTEEEAARVREVFSRIGTDTQTFWMPVCIDPCVIESYQWDRFAVDADAWGCVYGFVQTLDSETERRVLALLGELHDGSEHASLDAPAENQFEPNRTEKN